jgi:hypothetical protein
LKVELQKYAEAEALYAQVIDKGGPQVSAKLELQNAEANNLHKQ